MAAGAAARVAARAAAQRAAQQAARIAAQRGARETAQAAVSQMSKAGDKAKEAEKVKENAGTADCVSDCKENDPKDPCEHLKKGKGEGKYRGGAHGDGEKIGTSSPRNDGLDSHHMPAKDAYKGSSLSLEQGPAIMMEPVDHRKK